MKEIKYRVWHKREKVMRPVESLILTKHGGIWINDYPDTGACELMQYTGLEDKNGKEIYEGDILRYGYLALNDTGKFGTDPHLNLPKGIKENDITTEMGVFEVKPEIGFLANVEDMITRNPDVEGVEVIGNIYENPELLA